MSADVHCFTVQLFGYNWDDDRTTTLVTDVSLGRIRIVGSSRTYTHLAMLANAAQPHGDFELLSEAQVVADTLWDVFWDTRSDNYRDDNPDDTWQFVVAVFADTDELGERPLYIRGFKDSSYAPWNASVR